MFEDVEGFIIRPQTNYVERTIREQFEKELGKEMLDIFFLHYLHKYKQKELCKIYKINKDELNWRIQYIIKKIKTKFTIDDFND